MTNLSNQATKDKDLFSAMLINIKNLNKLLRKENLLFQAKKPDAVVKLLYRKLEITKILEGIYISIQNFPGSISGNLKKQIIMQHNIMQDLSNINKKYLEKESGVIKAILSMIIEKKNVTNEANKTYTCLHKMKACI